ncbi:MAG: threonine/serine dehydratase [Gemmatimonadota bacterium]
MNTTEKTAPAAGASTRVTLEDIRAAAVILDGVAVRTPLIEAPALSRITGVPVALKCEHLQPIGAFKIRGAYHAIARLPAEDRVRGVVTHSSGNHGQAVAYAAQRLGVRAVIVMPEDATRVKVEGVQRYGGEVVFVHDRTQRESRCMQLAAERGLVVVPPYENPDVIAGQGTCGLEILEDWPQVETILVPVGGGGLIAGIATAAVALKPGIRVIGVEPAGAAKLSAALAAGRPTRLERSHSIADGLLPLSVGVLPFQHLDGVVHQAVRVEEDDLAQAVRFLHDEMGLRVEPSGAASTAALLAGRYQPTGPAVAVISGGNVDPDVFYRLTH